MDSCVDQQAKLPEVSTKASSRLELSWKFAWNVKMIIDAVDPHRRPGTKAQKVEMFVGCESLPYKVSGHIF